MKTNSPTPGKVQDASEKKSKLLDNKSIRFLKAVDLIIAEKAKFGLEKLSTTSISKLIFNNKAAISKIKNGRRSISTSQLESFANYFGIDYNFFFRDDVDLYFKPKKFNGNISATKESTISLESHNNIIQTGGGENTGNIHFGEVYKRIQNAKTIINQFSSESPQREYQKALDNILEETKKLERLVIQKTEEIKATMLSLSTQVFSLERELKTVISSEANLMKRYIELLEEKVRWQSSTIEASTPMAETVLD